MAADKSSRLLTLQEHCFLTVLGHASTYSPEYLALVPPRLRTVLAFNLSVHDLHRVQQCPPFLEGLSIMEVDHLWMNRYKTTLTKFSNVASLDLDVETHHPNKTLLSLTWKDRYLMACLLNIPRQYGRVESPWSIAIYGISDIALFDGQLYKASVGSTRCSLHCYRKSNEQYSSNFISTHYQISLAPFSQYVGQYWPIIERVKLFQQLFPNWAPPYIPIHYDLPTAVQSYDHVKQAIIYSNFYETKNNAEINENDERPLNTPESFNEFLNTHSNTLDTVILYAPAIQKDSYSDTYTPLSVTSSTLTDSLAVNLHSLRHLSISMSNHDTSCLSTLPNILPSFRSTLSTLHLRILRPNLTEPCTPLLGSSMADLFRDGSCFQDLIIQGIVLYNNSFVHLMTTFINSVRPHHQSIVLRNIKLIDGVDQPNVVIHKQSMPVECRYMKSMYIHRLLNTQSLLSVLSAYDSISLDTLSLSLISDQVPLPLQLKLHAHTVCIERMLLNSTRLVALQTALTDKVNAVKLSLNEATPLGDTVAIFNEAISFCSTNLVCLDFIKFPLQAPTLNQLESIFVTIFSLPASTLSNLEFNACNLIESFAASLATANGLQLGQFSHGWRTHVQSLQLKYTIDSWRLLYTVWCNVANGTKLKVLRVSFLALEHFVDDLEMIAINLTTPS